MTNSPYLALVEFIETHYDATKTDVYPASYGSPGRKVNPAWYEKSRQMMRQIYLSTNTFLPSTEHKFLQQDIRLSPIVSETVRYVYVAAPSMGTRNDMVIEMRRIFDPRNGLCIDYVSSDGTVVNMFLLLREYPIDKDAKNEANSWIQVFEIHIYW